MSLDAQGILGNLSLSNDQVTVLEPYARFVYTSEAPLFSRIEPAMADAQSYNTTLYDVRPRLYTLNAAIVGGDTSITLIDATPFNVGDILEIQNTAGSATERVQVTALTSSTVLAIKRAASGTTALANDTTGGTSTKVVKLITQTSTGAETNKAAHAPLSAQIQMYVQTFMQAVQVGGLAQAVRNTRLPAGIPDVFTKEQKIALTEIVRDIEYAMYYGIPQAQTSGGYNAQMAGLKYLIGYYGGQGVAPAASANTNVKTNGGSSYTFTNFFADTIQKCIDGGGDPDTVICSTFFFNGLQIWGYGKQQINQPDARAVGVPITSIVLPINGKSIEFVPSYQLDVANAGTAIVLTSEDVTRRNIRDLFWQPRGVIGDAIQGDYIGDTCIEIGHPGYHAWISGITGFA